MLHPANLRTALLCPTLLAILILATMSALACGGSGSPTVRGQLDVAATPVAVELTTVEIETVARSIVASGSIEPWRRVRPATKILGRIDEVRVREGDRVARGELLARLEKRDLEAAAAQARAAVAMAEAELDRARAQHERMAALRERGSATPKNLEDATAGFSIAEAALGQAQANLAAAQVALGYADIESPLAGWVVEQHAEAGDMANPGVPLFTLEDLARVKIRAEVAEADVVTLERGEPARLTVLDRRLEATVDRVIPAGDPASRTFTVELIVDNAAGDFKSGMYARIELAGVEEEVLRIPRTALVERGQLEGVFVAGGDGRVRLRWVKTGRLETADGAPPGTGRVEILAGLEAGERIVAKPPAGLVDGARIAA